MSQDVLVERFFETLINGDRPAARLVLNETFTQGTPVETVITGLLWPSHELIEKLHRADQITTIAYHYSTRLLRMLVDQTSARLTQQHGRGPNVFAVCGTSEGEELGAQMAVDLLESRGFQVRFAGGGVPADEILSQVHENRPDILLMFCSAASDLPGIRQVIDTLREIGASPTTRIVVGGGVFNRAEGLAEEIGVETCAADPLDLVELLTLEPAATAGRIAASSPTPIGAQRTVAQGASGTHAASQAAAKKPRRAKVA